MTEDTRNKASELAETLRARGHAEPAAKLSAAATAMEAVEGVFLRGLRDALQSALTAIEAIDPVSATMIDELRLEVDKRLIQHHS
ncbi:MAG: hypothetical protein KGL52_11305 [Rhodospirillales bacterium]|jgi:hypothetical protein|nr:hypothetical protein [Rhodospirillales bacterium]